MKILLCSVALLVFLQTLFAQKEFRNEKVKWVPFDWADPDAKDAILVRTSLDTLPYIFNWQLDTGSPYTFMYGRTVKMFAIDYPVIEQKIRRSDTINSVPYLHIYSPAFSVKKQTFLPKNILINYNTGGGFPQEYIQKYKGARFDIGTMGVDIFKNKVLIINFKNNTIGFADALSKKWYAQHARTTSFTFYKNRIILPMKIGTETYSFFYDCGASMFPLQTTLQKSQAFAPAVLTDTMYNINNMEAGTSHNVAGGIIEKPVSFGSRKMNSVKVYVETSPSPIFDEANVTGLIGNQLFLQNTLVIDFRNKWFTILE